MTVRIWSKRAGVMLLRARRDSWAPSAGASATKPLRERRADCTALIHCHTVGASFSSNTSPPRATTNVPDRPPPARRAFTPKACGWDAPRRPDAHSAQPVGGTRFVRTPSRRGF